MTCDYGCGQDALHQLKNGKNCCSSWPSRCPSIKEKNSSGLKQAYSEGRKELVFDDVRRAKSRISIRDNSAAKAFVQHSLASNDTIKNLLFLHYGVEHKCQNCGISEWQNIKIPLELDHINGINNDNRIENLRLLCPNCHAITPTWRGRNINSGKTKITDKELLTAFEKCGNIRKTLLEVGLAAKGGNYARLQKLLKRKS